MAGHSTTSTVQAQPEAARLEPRGSDVETVEDETRDRGDRQERDQGRRHSCLQTGLAPGRCAGGRTYVRA
jgi:hypothetical protein